MLCEWVLELVKPSASVHREQRGVNAGSYFSNVLVIDLRYGVMTMLFERSEVVESATTSRLNKDSLTTVRDEHHADWPALTEDKQQIAAWNATEQEYPTDACVQQLIARQATATP